MRQRWIFGLQIFFSIYVSYRCRPKLANINNENSQLMMLLEGHRDIIGERGLRKVGRGGGGGIHTCYPPTR